MFKLPKLKIGQSNNDNSTKPSVDSVTSNTEDTTVDTTGVNTESTASHTLINSEADTIEKNKHNTTKTKLRKPLSKKKLAILAFFIFVVGAFTALTTYSYAVTQELISEGKKAQFTAMEAYELFKGQNLIESEKKLNELDNNLGEIQRTYNKLGFLGYLPLAKNYYQDGQHGLRAAEAGLSAGKKAIASITPYADVLGFSGEGTFEGGTTEDRVRMILDTLDLVTPVIDEMMVDLQTMKSELSQIDASRYPDSISGKPVRPLVEQAQSLSSNLVSSVSEYRPVIDKLAYMAGAGGESRQYLILFQNDNELRPTGGFLTAYAIIEVVDGKVIAKKSDDIYELDKKFRKTEPIPEKLGRYLTTEKNWNLRDMNISPDFRTSMETFYKNYQDVPGEPSNAIDGIIAVDTHFLTTLLDVLGPVAVPGYGTFSTENDPRCDCPQIIRALSEIITRPTPYIREDRKGVLGPLMSAILEKAYGAPKQEWPNLFASGLASVQEKHAQFYFLDEELQKAAETIDVAGRMKPPTDNTDFLGVVNANLAGAKSNLFIGYDIKQTISDKPTDGFISKTVEITYRNSHKADNCNLEAGLLCLNSTLKDWTRLYVPKGSKLVEAQGFSEDPEVYEEAGMTVFDGYFKLEPLSQAKIVLTYEVPYTDDSEYNLQIWKQAGIDGFDTLIDVTGGQEKISVVKDVLYSTEF